MESLQIFKHHTFGTLGVLSVNGKELFPATECARLLGYVNPKEAIKWHTRRVLKHTVLTAVGEQVKNFISEVDLYRLIVHSELPEAAQIEAWIFDEILPSICKPRVYTPDQLLSDPDLFIRLLEALKASRATNTARTECPDSPPPALEPLNPLSYEAKVMACDEPVTITTIAKDYGKTSRWLNEYLHRQGVQFKRKRTWRLYQKYADSSYTSKMTNSGTAAAGAPRATIHIYWTQQGRLFIYELLKADGILPLMEVSA